MGKIQQYLVKQKAGMTHLALAVDKHQGTVQRWINAGRIPDAHDRYLIAVTCGCSEEEALELASECSSEVARTA
jgi:hypothetical protein